MSKGNAPKALATSGTMKAGVLLLRADQSLLQEIKSRARQRQVSANRFVIEAVKSVLKSEQEKEKEQEWRAGFETMGRDPDTNNVEYALPAAREVMSGGTGEGRTSSPA